jgi:hypothetical protein
VVQESQSLPALPPAAVTRLLWEYDAAIRADPPFRILAAKIAEHGDIDAIRWLLATHGPDRLAAWLRSARVVSLDERAAAFWCLLTGVRRDEIRISPTWMR